MEWKVQPCSQSELKSFFSVHCSPEWNDMAFQIDDDSLDRWTQVGNIINIIYIFINLQIKCYS